MRAAVYSGTKNIYEQMLTAAKSLLIHSNVEKIYFLIEDDKFPYELPPEIECINISNQQYFKPDGPNFNNVLSYMVLIRVAYTKIFPDLDRILTIDVDTIVNENISDLWELNLNDYYLAGVEEVEVSKNEGSYINMGVAMLNLKKIREEHKDDELINNLNTFWYRWNEQDAINQLFRGHILILPGDYNACWQAQPPKHEKITHFAGIYDLNHFPNFNYYKNLSLDKINRDVKDRITLDIIIPTYNNKYGLHKTLSSITSRPDINVIVVDDGSDLDYNDTINEYPNIQFYHLSKNCGPGIARQYGIEHSNGTYIMFLDTGDYFYPDGLKTILDQIKENTYIKTYSWAYVYDKNNILYDAFDYKMIGKVFKRSFIEMYNIHFSIQGSYANEDFGFIEACKLIFESLEERKFSPMYKHIRIPVVYEHYDKNSITKNNNREFTFTKMAKGLAINALHAAQLVKEYNIPSWSILRLMCKVMAQEYYIFLQTLCECPERLDDVWIDIRDAYFKTYYIYKKFGQTELRNAFINTTLPFIKRNLSNCNISFNILQFINEIEQEELPPIKYYK